MKKWLIVVLLHYRIRCVLHRHLDAALVVVCERVVVVLAAFQWNMLLNRPTNIVPAALQRASRGWPPHIDQPALIHWVAQRWAARWASSGPPDAGCFWAYSFILWRTSVPPDFPLHWFWPPTANLMLPLCLLQWHRVSFQPITTGWIVTAGLLILLSLPDFCWSTFRHVNRFWTDRIAWSASQLKNKRSTRIW